MTTIIHRTLCLIGAVIIAATVNTSSAFAGPLKIKENTNYYSISGTKASEFAASMSKKGPYSRQHRRRAWATAYRDLSFQLTRQQRGKSCRVRAAKVSMEITYTLPKLRSSRGVSRRQLKKWRQMASLLTKHERVHGRFYKQLARKVHKALKRLAPARTCRALDRKAKALVDALSEKDSVRNNRFDRRDTRNYRRMARIYRGS